MPRADKAGHGLEVAANWPVPFWLTDTAMAVQNLLLLVEAHRLGALYFGIFRNVDVLLADLGVPEGMLSVGAVAIGHRAATDRQTGSPTTRPRRAPPKSSTTTTGDTVGSDPCHRPMRAARCPQRAQRPLPNRQ